MKIAYKRASPTDKLEVFKFDGSATIHFVLWPIRNNPHAGVLLVADRIHMSDGTSGTALLIDLKRRGKTDRRSFIAVGLLDGDIEYAHTILSLMFNIPPTVEPLFTLPRDALGDLNEVLEQLNNNPFSLISEEIGMNCVSLVNDIICHYTNLRTRYRIQFFGQSSEFVMLSAYQIKSTDET